MPKKQKHPMEMTDEEALKHVFHPKIAKAVGKHVKGQKRKGKKPGSRLLIIVEHDKQ